MRDRNDPVEIHVLIFVDNRKPNRIFKSIYYNERLLDVSDVNKVNFGMAHAFFLSRKMLLLEFLLHNFIIT